MTAHRSGHPPRRASASPALDLRNDLHARRRRGRCSWQRLRDRHEERRPRPPARTRPPPSTPTGLATSAVGATSATLSWTASTDNVAVTGYRLFQGGSQVGTSATTSFGYTGLTCATTYTLGVAAVDAAGNVSGTATKSVTTAACPDTTPPSTPVGLSRWDRQARRRCRCRGTRRPTTSE